MVMSAPEQVQVIDPPASSGVSVNVLLAIFIDPALLWALNEWCIPRLVVGRSTTSLSCGLDPLAWPEVCFRARSSYADYVSYADSGFRFRILRRV